LEFNIQLEELVRFKWQSKIKELGVVDTNSTTNWRRLAAEIRQQLLSKCETADKADSPSSGVAKEAVTPASLLHQIKHEVVARVLLKVHFKYFHKLDVLLV
jgi:hypothetical protein